MAYSDFKSISQVLEKYPLKVKQQRFLPETEVAVPEYLLDNLNFLLDMQSIEENEAFYTEGFIFPLLQEFWKRHKSLKLWSHSALNVDKELNGSPDYLLAYLPQEQAISRLMNQPYLAVIEAKKEDFTQGWGQCLAAMIACQKLNENSNHKIFGIVSTGLVWEFAFLQANAFIKDPRAYSINNLVTLAGVLDFIFMQCERQVVEG